MTVFWGSNSATLSIHSYNEKYKNYFLKLNNLILDPIHADFLLKFALFS